MDTQNWTLHGMLDDEPSGIPVIGGIAAEDALAIWGMVREGADSNPESDVDLGAFIVAGRHEILMGLWIAGGIQSWPAPRPADGVYRLGSFLYMDYVLVEDGAVTASLCLAAPEGEQRQLSTVWAQPGAGRGLRLLLAALADAPTPLAADTTMSAGACALWSRALRAPGVRGVEADVSDTAIHVALLGDGLEADPVRQVSWSVGCEMRTAARLAFNDAFRVASDRGVFLTNTPEEDAASTQLRKEYGWLARCASP